MADIPAVLALDQRCLGGLWTASGYQKELVSDYSDLCVLVSALTAEPLQQRQQLLLASDQASDQALIQTPDRTPNQTSGQTPDQTSRKITDSAIYPNLSALAASDPTTQISSSITLIGVGCLWAILEEAHITTLAIEPSYQGQKLGLLLLTHLLECSRRRGLTRATLEVRASNQTALALYRKFGFKEAGQRRRYYSDGEDARILWRSGLQSEDCAAQIAQYRQHAIAYISRHYGHVITDIQSSKY